MKERTVLLLALAWLPTGLVHADEPPPIVVERVVEEAAQAEDAKPKADAAEAQAAKKAEAKPAEKNPDEADLQKKMRELERALLDTRNKLQQQAKQQREEVKKDAIKALGDIKLPKNPTREQCEAYIDEIRQLCEGPNNFISSDPVTNKLKEIPSEHFDLLLKEIANRSKLYYHSNYAMAGFDPEKLRERFIKTFDDNPKNIRVVVMYGWCEDVRPAIIRYLQTADDSISPAWFQAAVELAEPALYPKLHELTTQSRFADQFISILETLPDYDLVYTIDICWRRAKEGNLSVSLTAFADKAASYGNVDALGTLVDQLGGSTFSNNARRANVLRLIDYRGSEKDIRAWYKTNKDKLVFDGLRKRFVVSEDF